MLSLFSRGMFALSLIAISLGKNATLFKLFLFWNFLKLLPCGSKFNHSHFRHYFVSTMMYVSNHRVSFLYFYINMIPFVYLFLRGFTFAYVMGFGIFSVITSYWDLLFLCKSWCVIFLTLYSLGSLGYNALNWWAGVGGGQITWRLLHPSLHKGLLSLSLNHFCIQSFGIPQKAHWLKTTAVNKKHPI